MPTTTTSPAPPLLAPRRPPVLLRPSILPRAGCVIAFPPSFATARRFDAAGSAKPAQHIRRHDGERPPPRRPGDPARRPLFISTRRALFSPAPRGRRKRYPPPDDLFFAAYRWQAADFAATRASGFEDSRQTRHAGRHGFRVNVSLSFFSSSSFHGGQEYKTDTAPLLPVYRRRAAARRGKRQICRFSAAAAMQNATPSSSLIRDIFRSAMDDGTP